MEYVLAAPMTKAGAALLTRTLDQLKVEDARAFRPVALYGDLAEVLRRRAYPFRVIPRGPSARWDRALLLNLAFWGADEGGDILVGERIPADVVAHAAWHHLAARALGTRGRSLSADALFLGEAIASAFDVYLVGRLLAQGASSAFLDTQVPAMAEVAQEAGLSAAKFERLLAGIAADPAGAFEDLRQLLFDVSTALVACEGAGDALRALAGFDGHRFSPVLHHYALPSWVLYARAYAPKGLRPDARVRKVDRALRDAVVSLDWLHDAWVAPALAEKQKAKKTR